MSLSVITGLLSTSHFPIPPLSNLSPLSNFQSFPSLERDVTSLESRGIQSDFKRCSKFQISKTRYPNVLPKEETIFGDGSINANYIFLDEKNKKYVAASAPTPHEMNNFYIQLYENNVEIIVQVTDYVEKRIIKAHKYIVEEGEKENFGPIQVEHVSTKIKNFKQISSDRDYDHDRVVITTMTLVHENNPSIVKKIQHVFYKGWPDMDVPNNIKPINYIIRKMMTSTLTLVHCSAGIGRTGVLITSCLILENNKEMQYFKDFTLDETLEKVRVCRPKSVPSAPTMVSIPSQIEYIKTIISSFKKSHDDFSESAEKCKSDDFNDLFNIFETLNLNSRLTGIRV